MDKLDKLKAEIKREIIDVASLGIAIAFLGMIAAILEHTGLKNVLPTFSLIIGLTGILLPLLYGFYYVYHVYVKPVFLGYERNILAKTLAKREEIGRTKPPIQQRLEGYLEKAVTRPGDVDFWGNRLKDTYPIETATAHALKITGGERNLFTTIDQTRTIWGRQRLQWLLTHPYKNTERIRNRQEIVRILNENNGAREELSRSLEAVRDSWVRNIVIQKPPKFSYTPRIALLIGLVILGISYLKSHWDFLSLIGIFITFFAFFNLVFFKLHANEIKVLSYVNDVLRNTERLKETLEGLDIGNNAEIEQLLKDLDIVNSTLKELKTPTGFFSRLKTFFNMDETRQMLIRSMFFEKDTPDYYWSQVLSAIGELDAYLSLAELPERFPNWETMPEIAEPDKGVPLLDIEEGYSPIIPIEISQPNSVLLNGDNRVLVIGGAHGAGKSTFLHIINQLEVLGSIGSFVPAKHMRFTPVQILVSMDVQDAPGEGQSYFGKVARFLNRLYWGSRPSYSDEKPPMHVVSFDEFLEGTNTPEARIIAETVIKWLSKHNMPAIIVTQDTEVLKLLDAKRIPKVNIAHPERVAVSGKRFAYIIAPGLPDEIAICRELLKRPLNRYLRKAILKVMQGKAELEDLPATGSIKVDIDETVETSV